MISSAIGWLDTYTVSFAYCRARDQSRLYKHRVFSSLFQPLLSAFLFLGQSLVFIAIFPIL